MAGAYVKVDDREVRAALRRLIAAGGELRQPLGEIGEKLTMSHKERWGKQESPSGKAWAPLSPTYKERKRKNPDKVLVLGGYLRDLLRYQVAPDGKELVFGTDRIYGATHQFGRGNIPKREFLGLSEADKAMIVGVLGRYYSRAAGEK